MLFTGTVHNDFSEQNLLVKKSATGCAELAGILDFQDVHHNCKVYDVAIYMMYMMTVCESPIEVARSCLQGFLEKGKLTQPELDVLYYCVAARFAQSLVLGLYNYAMTQNPYCVVTQKLGWKAIRKMWALPSQEVTKLWVSPTGQ